MIGLDTNVLVRYIMQDDVKQSLLATRLIESCSPESPGFVPLVSIVELFWVMSSAYRLDGDRQKLDDSRLRRSCAVLVDAFMAPPYEKTRAHNRRHYGQRAQEDSI